MTTARRLALIVLFILLTASRATPASAGQYAVYACYPGVADVNHAWVALTNHGGMIARANCPVPASVTSGREQGLYTRHKRVSNRNATVPGGSFSSWVFTAPPGAVLTSIAFQNAMCAADGFRAGIRNAAGAWLLRTPRPCKLAYAATASPKSLNLAGTRAVLLMTQCVKGPCRVGGGLHASATLQFVRVIVADSTRPRIGLTGGSAITPGWKRGDVTVSFAAADNVGILYADIARGTPIHSVDARCDFTRPRPCPDLVHGFKLGNSRHARRSAGVRGPSQGRGRQLGHEAGCHRGRQHPSSSTRIAESARLDWLATGKRLRRCVDEPYASGHGPHHRSEVLGLPGLESAGVVDRVRERVP